MLWLPWHCALAEAGLDYDVVTISDDNDYRRSSHSVRFQPTVMTRSNCSSPRALVLHIAGLSTALVPTDAQDAAQTQSWVFAALDSVEPRVDNLILPLLFHGDESWVAGWRPHAEWLVNLRLKSLSGCLKDPEWLTGPL